MILLGGIFSVAWLLVICGSIQWQNNWEAHIDKLENKITGPLYKTVYYKGRCYYSVSKISKTLAWVVIAVWCILLIRYVLDNFIMFRNIFTQFKKVSFVILPIIVAIVCVIHLLFCCKTANGKIKADLQGKPGVFLVRTSGE
jgi:sensor histidine kinase YesM